MIIQDDVNAVVEQLKNGGDVCTRPGVLVAAKAILSGEQPQEYDHACGNCGHVSQSCSHVCEVD